VIDCGGRKKTITGIEVKFVLCENGEWYGTMTDTSGNERWGRWSRDHGIYLGPPEISPEEERDPSMNIQFLPT